MFMPPDAAGTPDRYKDRVSDSFLTTRWSLVAAAGRQQPGAAPPAGARAALESLCRAYWPPLYAFARRTGERPDEAADLVQDFFARLLEKGDLAAADPQRGRFRAWLLTAFRHHASNVRDRERAAKRGGGRRPLSLDAPRFDAGEAETRYGEQLADPRTPEAEYERQWALLVLERALERLSSELRRAGKDRELDALRPFLTAGDEGLPYATVAQSLGRSEGAIKVAVHRLRRRYGELLREEVAGTLADPREVADELASLIAALAAR
jgi:RNA polymerase sigma-70 factor (ECF subfamily)